MFYHSKHIFEEIGSDSLFEESEMDVDNTALREMEENAINEFEDISSDDKEFFKLFFNLIY